MKQYHNLLKQIMEHGVDEGDRTGTGTRSIFGAQMRFDLSKGFPAITTKKLQWEAVVSELLWFLEGSTDERRLAELRYGEPRKELIGKRTIWTDNANNQGVAIGYHNDDEMKFLGPVYGSQWRTWGTYDGHYFDQILSVLNSLRNDPYSRRHIVSAWNVADIDRMALPPCHYSFQFYVRNNTLSCLWNQRSADMFLGIPFNIASYALLTHIFARELNMQVGDLTGNIGDAHIYHNHFDQVNEQISREEYELPELVISDRFDLFQGLVPCGQYDFDTVNDFELSNYRYHPPIKAKMAI